jgi:8-oxo-dGTP pyrophosphatase MutT (NUDIX family)
MSHHEENPWRIVDSKQVYENPWIRVTEFDVINPSGNPGIYGKVHFKNRAVGIVPMDEEGCIWLVGQYRFTIDAYSWEIPEGGCPAGMSTEEAALRELREETGILAGRLEKLFEMHLSNSVSDEWGIVYLATGLTMGQASPEETESLSVRRLPLEEAYGLVLDGTVTDSMSVAAILRLWIGRLGKSNGQHV